MKKANIKTTTYQYEDNYYIDIVEKEDEFEAWIYNIECGIKDMMFGSPKEQTDRKDFIKLVSDTDLSSYILAYFLSYEI